MRRSFFLLTSSIMVACGSSGTSPSGSDDALAEPETSSGADASIVDGDVGADTSPDALGKETGGDADAVGDARDTRSGNGDSCDEAVDITAAIAASGSYVGTAKGSGPDSGSCGGGSKKAYLRWAATPGNWTIQVSAAGDPSAVAYVRTTCADPSTELACNNRATFLDTRIGVKKARDVFIVLDGATFATAFTVSIVPYPRCIWPDDCYAAFGSSYTCDKASGACVKGIVCTAPTADCDVDPDTGCEADLSADIANCGSCGNACKSAAHSTPVCRVRFSTGSCEYTCDAGWTHCPGDASAGCLQDLSVDASHCGSCTNTCAALAPCNDGACGAVPATFATGQNGVDLMIADGPDLFWTNKGTSGAWGLAIAKAPKSGGTPVKLATAPSEIGSMAVDATDVYFIDKDRMVKKVPRAGGAITTLSKKVVIEERGGLYVDAGYVYFVGYPSLSPYTKIMKVPKAGGAELVAVSTPSPPYRFVMDASGFYYTQDTPGGTGLYFAKPDGTGATMLSPIIPRAMITDATRVFYTQTDGVYSLPKAGGASTLLADADSYSTLATAGGQLYISFNDYGPFARSLSRVPVGGGKRVYLSWRTFGNQSSIAADGTTVWFGDGGSIYQTAP